MGRTATVMRGGELRAAVAREADLWVVFCAAIGAVAMRAVIPESASKNGKERGWLQWVMRLGRRNKER